MAKLCEPTLEPLTLDCTPLDTARHGLARAQAALAVPPILSEDLREARAGISQALAGWRELSLEARP